MISLKARLRRLEAKKREKLSLAARAWLGYPLSDEELAAAKAEVLPPTKPEEFAMLSPKAQEWLRG